jgi:hypothetical protein
MKIRMAFWAVAVSVTPSLLQAQFDFKVDGRDVQIHSFASQSFLSSNDNSYLTLDTSHGSFGFTDGGVNASSQVTDRFRVGAQGYFRKLGSLNTGQVYLDWAVADYRFKSWFGMRVGKVKTALGLYNDTQDQDALHTWALLPQSMYPIDLRSATIAHVGGDFYGTIPLRRLGRVAYTAYGGIRPNDPHEGYRYFLRDGLPMNGYSGPMGGGDVKWTTPLKGVLMGASYLTQHPSGTGKTGPTFGPVPLPVYQESVKNQISQFYVEYTLANLKIDGEYRRDYRDQLISVGGGPSNDPVWNARAWYISGAYRVGRYLELGSYYSFFVPHWESDWSPPGNHIYDKVVSARIDLTKFWTVKVEGHFIDGYGAIDSTRGFYDLSFGGIETTKPQTKLLMIRTGVSF